MGKFFPFKKNFIFPFELSHFSTYKIILCYAISLWLISVTLSLICYTFKWLFWKIHKNRSKFSSFSLINCFFWFGNLTVTIVSTQKWPLVTFLTIMVILKHFVEDAHGCDGHGHVSNQKKQCILLDITPLK